VFEVVMDAARMSTLLGVSYRVSWRTLLEQGRDAMTAYWRLVMGKLRLVNTVKGERLILAGEEHEWRTTQWPEESKQHRQERNSAIKIQKIMRSKIAWRVVRKLRVYSSHEREARRRKRANEDERDRRSSAATVLQGSVKRGIARQKADSIRSTHEEEMKDKSRRQATKRRIDNAATEISRIIRGGVSRRKVARLRIERRSADKEKLGIFEADVVIDGTRLFIEGSIQIGLTRVEELVYRLVARDCSVVGRRKMEANLIITSKTVMSVLRRMEDEWKRTDETTASSSAVEQEEKSVGEVNKHLGLGRWGLRGLFLRIIDNLTLFKNVDQNIFILALKAKEEF
jgi:hypothetical protein